VRQQAIDLKDFPSLVAKRFGVYNINPLGSHFSSTDTEYLEAFCKAMEKAGCHIVDLGLSGRNFCDPDMSKREEAVEYGKRWIDISAIIQSPSVRQHLSGHVQPNLTLAVDSLSRLAEYGARRNVVVNLENDNPIAEDPFFLVEVIQRVSSHYLRALPDFGNSLMRHDEAYNERAVKAMFRYAYNMAHVKDAVSSDDGRLVPVDVAKMFDIAKDSGYQGYFSMEYDIDAGDPFDGTKKLIQQSLRYLT
jgi:sugar phosphate isomerase/epimerase